MSISTSRTITGLTDGIEYEFRAAAVNACGVGAYSQVATALIGPPPPPPDPDFESVALLLRANGDAVDESGNVTFGSWASYGAGRFDSNAFLFDGTYNALYSPSDTMDLARGLTASFGYPLPAFFTVEMWFKSTATGYPQTLFDTGAIHIFLDETGVVNAVHGQYGYPSAAMSLAGGWSDDQWHHLAYIRYSQNGYPHARMYVDGALQVDNQYLGMWGSGSSSPPGGSFIAIGARAPSSYFSGEAPWGFGFNGLIDSVRVSRIARYSGASFDVPTAPFGGPIPPLPEGAAVSRPENNFATSASEQVAYSVIASAVTGETYQWQALLLDMSTYQEQWLDIPGKTAASITLQQSDFEAISYDAATYAYISIRCVVSVGGNTLVSETAHHAQFHASYFDVQWSTSSTYQSPVSGPTLDNQSYYALPNSGDPLLESATWALYDMSMGMGSYGWFSGDDLSAVLEYWSGNGLPVESSAEWSPVTTIPVRTPAYIDPTGFLSSGVRYYRVKAVRPWPLAATDGSLSADRAPPEVVLSRIEVTFA